MDTNAELNAGNFLYAYLHRYFKAKRSNSPGAWLCHICCRNFSIL